MNQETCLSPDTVKNTFIFFELLATVLIWYSRRRIYQYKTTFYQAI